ncbi:MAG: hypothetical protein H7Z16_14845 [Pyrinomonadaceae bacterium]|nr:hypothetical protein [Pyrinomonadaceae bacterium]
MMRLLTSFRIVRATLALAVALWMAGAGCLLGCEKNVAAASTAVDQSGKNLALVVTGETCANHRTNAKHVSKAKHGSNAQPRSNTKHVSTLPSAESTSRSTTTKRLAADTLTFAFEAGRSSMMDCPLAVNATAALSRAGSDNANVGFALTNVNQPPVHSLEQITALAAPPRLPNRGHTYLRCCVFLI